MKFVRVLLIYNQGTGLKSYMRKVDYMKYEFRRTDGTNHDFIENCRMLDMDLDRRVGSVIQRKKYEKYNQLGGIKEAIVVYDGQKPIGGGAIRKYSNEEMELKRIFVHPEYQQQGIGTALVGALIEWAKELGFQRMILETAALLKESCTLYEKMGFKKIPNYGAYINMPESLCMAKEIGENTSNVSIEEGFNMIAKEYDSKRRKFIPCFDEYYDHTTKWIVANINKPQSVLDLGAGTGLLTNYWMKECSTANYLLVDIADEMLDVSRKRFEGNENVRHQVLDYSKELPQGQFDVIISALSIHHLDDIQKERLFQRIYDKLPEGGVFVNYDQFCAQTPKMSEWFDTSWEKQIISSGLSERDIEFWKMRRKFDKECTVNKEIEMLSRSRFSEVQCVYSCQKFSVLVGVK